MSRQRTKTEIMRHEQYFAKLIENAENAMREYQQERGGEHRLYVEMPPVYDKPGKGKEGLKQSISRLATWYAPLLLGRHEKPQTEILLTTEYRCAAESTRRGEPAQIRRAYDRGSFQS